MALAILFSGLLSCGKAPVDVVPGVSLELAKHRAATISNINYELSLRIPEREDQEIEGFVTISFELSDGASPLQLDFRESSDKISRVVANGELTDFLFQDEHIVIPGSDLTTGHEHRRNRVHRRIVVAESKSGIPVHVVCA